MVFYCEAQKNFVHFHVKQVNRGKQEITDFPRVTVRGFMDQEEGLVELPSLVFFNYCSIVDLQCCASFSCTVRWIYADCMLVLTFLPVTACHGTRML